MYALFFGSQQNENDRVLTILKDSILKRTGGDEVPDYDKIIDGDLRKIVAAYKQVKESLENDELQFYSVTAGFLGAPVYYWNCCWQLEPVKTSTLMSAIENFLISRIQVYRELYSLFK